MFKQLVIRVFGDFIKIQSKLFSVIVNSHPLVSVCSAEGLAACRKNNNNNFSHPVSVYVYILIIDGLFLIKYTFLIQGFLLSPCCLDQSNVA